MEKPASQSEKEFLNPQEVISQLEIKEGSYVADFGCASGYFSIPFAEAIGENGKLFAIDILPQVLETVESKARTAGIANIETKRANLEKKDGSGLPKGSIDWVILKDVLFQNKNKEIILEEAYSVLKKEGRAIVIEWSDKSFLIGPDREVRISKEDLKEMAQKQGFIIEKELNVGDFHCAFVAKK